jgi:predicted secreted protein
MGHILKGPQNGRSLGIFINNVLVAYSKTCSLSIKAGTMDITTKDSILWDDFLPTVKDWSITCDGLVAYNSSANIVNLMDLLIAGTKVVAKFSVHDSGNLYHYGSAYVVGCDQTGDMDSPISFTASFTGDGVLTKARMT